MADHAQDEGEAPVKTEEGATAIDMVAHAEPEPERPAKTEGYPEAAEAASED